MLFEISKQQIILDILKFLQASKSVCEHTKVPVDV
jgi:hypothetical protein